MVKNKNRSISDVTKRTLALILAGGRGSRLHELTEWRAKPAVPFGGKFRIIDFPLSNCVNSGINRMGVVTQYKSHSLVRHLVKAWSGFRAEFGESMDILPASMRVGDEWYKGTADAVFQNLDIIRTHQPEFILILGGDHIYKMDYGPLIDRHSELNADMSVCCVEVSVEEAAGSFGVIEVDASGRVVGFEEKPEHPREIPGKPGRVLASMGNYVFTTEFLYDELVKDADDGVSSHDFGNDILPRLVTTHRIYAFRLGEDRPNEAPYWRDVGTLDALFEANLELVELTPALNMYDEEWPIYTDQMQLPSAKFVHDKEGRTGMAINSIVSGGCVVSGAELNRCLLFSNVRVSSYSRVRESVIMPDVTVGRNCRIERAIIDRGAELPAGTDVGLDRAADEARGYRVTDKGVTLVTPDFLGQTLHRAR